MHYDERRDKTRIYYLKQDEASAEARKAENFVAHCTTVNSGQQRSLGCGHAGLDASERRSCRSEVKLRHRLAVSKPTGSCPNFQRQSQGCISTADTLLHFRRIWADLALCITLGIAHTLAHPLRHAVSYCMSKTLVTRRSRPRVLVTKGKLQQYPGTPASFAVISLGLQRHTAACMVWVLIES